MIGQSIAHYKILAKIGAGGMGEVYLAVDSELKRQVALKFLPQSYSADPDVIERFKREAQAAAALNHPNIVTIHGTGEHDGRHYIVMEHVDGEPLSQGIAKKDISIDRALEVAIQVADGLNKSHQAHVVHRDIKPDNILIDKDGRVRILDFGLAKLRGSAELTQLTQEESTIGTVHYMSPEQTRGGEVDHRSDLFSLGVVLYEMIATQRPFQGDNRAAVMLSISNDPAQPLRRYNNQATDGLEAIVAKLLAKNPDERYQSAADLIVDLKRERAALGGQSPSSVSSQSAPVASGVEATQPAGKKNSKVMIGMVAVAALAIAYFVWSSQRDAGMIAEQLAETGAASKPFIAVLPLDNLSNDPEQEFFADGMTEALITGLAKIGGLKVISRTSVMQYKETTKPLPQIAKELGVSSIIEGSVLHAGERVRVTAQLINAATDEHLWANSYDRDVTDVLALQSELARTIANEIQVTLTPGEEVQLAQHKPVDPAAFESYLKGRHEWNKRAREGLTLAVKHFQDAIDADPTYALAYAGLANARINMVDWSIQPATEGYPVAKALVAKALELDPLLGEAQTAQAYATAVYDWNLERSLQEYERAIALNPNYATAYQWYGEVLGAMHRYDEALEKIDRALELDPLSLIMRSVRGVILIEAGRYDEARVQLKKLVAEHPDFLPARWHVFLLNLYSMKRERIAPSFLEFAKLDDSISPGDRDALEGSYHSSGLEGFMRELARQNEARYRSEERFFPAYDVAWPHAFLKEWDTAFTWLEKTLEERGTGLFEIIWDPNWKPVYKDPRFQSILERTGFKLKPGSS